MKEYAKQPEHSAGAPGKEPQARKQAPLGELLQAYRNNSPAQPEEMEDKGDAGEELNVLLKNLEAVVTQAMQIPGPEDEKKDALELAERLRELRVIAEGNNEEAKSTLLEGLKEELGTAGSPPALANVPPVQLLKPWQWGLIGTGAVIGIGTLLYKLYKNITNRPEAVEEDLPDNDMREDEVPGIDIPEELTEGITKFMSVEEIANRIFENINNFNFEYAGLALSAQIGFREHAGDCRTLTWMYIAVAEIFNLSAVQCEYVGEMLVNPQPIHGGLSWVTPREQRTGIFIIITG